MVLIHVRQIPTVIMVQCDVYRCDVDECYGNSNNIHIPIGWKVGRKTILSTLIRYTWKKFDLIILLRKFPHFRQADNKDCGPTCIKIIARYYGINISIQDLRSLSETTREGSNFLFLSKAAKKIGFHTLSVKINFKNINEVHLPCILHWKNEHFVVLYKVSKGNFYISDPAFGRLRYSTEQFLKMWTGSSRNELETEGSLFF